MINWVRKMVAGPKNTLTHNGSSLDLTYITPRIIAMAFPADTILEKTYRNDIEDVAKYLDEQHPEDYLIINVSSRNYNSQPFKGRVLEFQWVDHQTPTLSTLVDVGYQIWHFLSRMACLRQRRRVESWRCTAITAKVAQGQPLLPFCCWSDTSPVQSHVALSTTGKGSTSLATGSTSPAKYATSGTSRAFCWKSQLQNSYQPTD